MHVREYGQAIAAFSAFKVAQHYAQLLRLPRGDLPAGADRGDFADVPLRVVWQLMPLTAMTRVEWTG